MAENFENVTRREWEVTVVEDLHLATEGSQAGLLTYTIHPKKADTLILEVWDEAKENVLVTKHVRITIKNPPAGG